MSETTIHNTPAEEGYEIPPLPDEMRQKAVDHLRRTLDDKTRRNLRAAIAIDPEHWWTLIHFGAGMGLRNLLRKSGIPEGDLPTQNWDDYYVQIVEEAVREEPTGADAEMGVSQ